MIPSVIASLKYTWSIKGQDNRKKEKNFKVFRTDPLENKRFLRIY